MVSTKVLFGVFHDSSPPKNLFSTNTRFSLKKFKGASGLSDLLSMHIKSEGRQCAINVSSKDTDKGHIDIFYIQFVSKDASKF